MDGISSLTETADGPKDLCSSAFSAASVAMLPAGTVQAHARKLGIFGQQPHVRETGRSVLGGVTVFLGEDRPTCSAAFAASSSGRDGGAS